MTNSRRFSLEELSTVKLSGLEELLSITVKIPAINADVELLM